MAETFKPSSCLSQYVGGPLYSQIGSAILHALRAGDLLPSSMLEDIQARRDEDSPAARKWSRASTRVRLSARQLSGPAQFFQGFAATRRPAGLRRRSVAQVGKVRSGTVRKITAKGLSYGESDRCACGRRPSRTSMPSCPKSPKVGPDPADPTARMLPISARHRREEWSKTRVYAHAGADRGRDRADSGGMVAPGGRGTLDRPSASALEPPAGEDQPTETENLRGRLGATHSSDHRCRLRVDYARTCLGAYN